MKLRDNSERARKTIVFLWIMLGISAIGSIIDIINLKVLYEVKEHGYLYGATTLRSNLDTILIFAGFIGLVIIVVSILAWVFYIQWFRRAYFNMHTIKKTGLRYSEGWAAGAWFVPIFSWFGPYQIMRDLYDNAQAILLDKGLINENPSRITSVNLWWGLWIGGNILQLISNQGDKIADIDTQIIFAYMGIVSAIISIVAAVYAVKVVKNYHEMEVLLPRAVEVDGEAISMNSEDLLDS